MGEDDDGSSPSGVSLRELAEQLARDEIVGHLDAPGKLSGLRNLREEFERRLVAVRTQLEAGTSAQLEDMQAAQHLLRLAREEMQRVRESFLKIHGSCASVADAIENFEHVRKVRNARVNLGSVLQELTIYSALPGKLRELRSRLDTDERGSLKMVFGDWLSLNSWRSRILAQVSEAMTAASKEEERLDERRARWEELDVSADALSKRPGLASEAHSQILLVLDDHFRKVQDLGDRIWDIVVKRLRDFFHLAQFEESSHLVEAVEIVERIDLHDDRERRRRINLGEDATKLEMLLPPRKRRRDAVAELEKAIEARLSRRIPDSLLPESRSQKRISLDGAMSSEDEADLGDDSEEDEEEFQVEDSTSKESKVSIFLRQANEIIIELNTIAEDVVKCFPKSYNVLGLYRWVVERKLLELLQPVWSSAAILVGDKLRLIGWIDHYLYIVESLDRDQTQDVSSMRRHASFTSGTGKSSVSGASFAVIDNEGQKLQEDHRAAALSRTRELRRETEGMMATYIADSLTRMEQKYVYPILEQNDSPVAVATGTLQTAVPEDLFQALMQEVNVVRLTGVTGKHLASFVLRGVLEALRTYQGIQARKIEEDNSLEWLCALMNDCERMYDLCDNALIEEIRDGIDLDLRGADDVLSEVRDEIDKVASGFLKGVELASNGIVDHIFGVLEEKDVLAGFFSPAWESGSIRSAETVTATLADYFDDQEIGLAVYLASELMFGRLSASCFTKLVNVYVLKFMTRTEPFKNKQAAASRLRADAREFGSCFGRYESVLRHGRIRSRQVLEEKLDIIRTFADILEDAVPQNHFAEITQEFGTFSNQALARLLFLRGDLATEECKDLLLSTISEFVESTSATRFDLSSIPPLDEVGTLLEESDPSTSDVSPTSSTTKKYRRRNKKKRSKLRLGSTKNPPQQSKQNDAAVEMKLDDFLKK